MKGENGMKGEKKMKGCIQSQGGQYVLETHKGKSIPLTGADVAAHVGHTVALHGTWSSGSSATATSSGSMGSNDSTMGASGSGHAFNVTSVDMISETCNMGGKNKSSDNMDKQ